MTVIPQNLPHRAGTKLWSVKRIADRWSCSQSKVRQLIYAQKDKNGAIQPPRLPSVRFEGMVRVRNEDLEAFEACQTKLPTTGSANTEDDGSPSMDEARINAASDSVRRRARQAKRLRSERSAI